MKQHRWCIPIDSSHANFGFAWPPALRDLLRFAIGIAVVFTAIGCHPPSPGVVLIGIERVAYLDLNTATQAELMTLPGIGEVKANRIIAGRPYQSVEDLIGIDGIGPKLMATLRDQVTVQKSSPCRGGRENGLP